MPKQKAYLTSAIFLVLALAMAFLILNSPSTQIKEIANFQIILLTAGAFAIIPGIFFYPIKNTKDFLGDASIGTILGVIIFVVTAWMLGVGTGIVNLFAVFSLPSLAAFESTQIFFVAEIWPLTETIVLVGGTLVGIRLLKDFFKLKPKYAVPIAIFVVMLFFASYHFATYGRGAFEFSYLNLPAFVFNTENLGMPVCNPATGLVANCYAGALPQFILGGLWILIALATKSWVVAWRAHAISNKIVLFALFGLTPLIIGLLAIDAAILFIAFQKGLLSKELSTFKLENIFRVGT